VLQIHRWQLSQKGISRDELLRQGYVLMLRGTHAPCRFYELRDRAPVDASGKR